MKRVFSSQSQCAHVWAQQTQAEGRSNNVFFRGPDFYSYGHHYLAARIHKVKGKSFALVRSDSYGPATSGHLAEIRSALQGLMPYFCVDGVTTSTAYGRRETSVCTPREAVKQLDARAKASVASALRRVKVVDKRDIEWPIECIVSAYDTASDLRKLIGLASIRPKASDLIAVRAHLERRLARNAELNTPEAIEKRGVESQRRREAKEAREHANRLARESEERARQAKAIEDFRAGASSYGRIDSPYDLLRIQGNEVVTSRGARVKLSDARVLLRAIEAGIAAEGATIGDFTFRGTREMPELNDTEVTIGCHRVLMSEARKVLRDYSASGLSLVAGGAS